MLPDAVWRAWIGARTPGGQEGEEVDDAHDPVAVEVAGREAADVDGRLGRSGIQDIKGTDLFVTRARPQSRSDGYPPCNK